MKKILKIILAITVVLSSVFQVRPASATDESDVVDGSPDVPQLFLTIEFNLNGGVVTPDFYPQSVWFSDAIQRPAVDPIREGYMFTGWFTAAIGGSEFNFNLPALLAGRTVHAQWERILHVVTFDLRGGSGFFPSQVVNDGELVVMPEEEPVRTGYEFVGWFSDDCDDVPFDFNTPITQEMTFYAQ